MILSMTGFGAGEGGCGAVRAEATVKTVNGRGLDVRVALPAALSELEIDVAELVRGRVHRGRVDIRLAIESQGPPADGSGDAVRRVIAHLRSVRDEFGLAGDVTIGDVIAAAGRDVVAGAPIDLGTAREAVRAATTTALDHVLAFRRREGESTRVAMERDGHALAAVLAEVERDARAAVDGHRARLRARCAELAGGALDGARLEAEVALLAERTDVSEEVVRATEHVRALLSHLAAGAPGRSAGRTLEFLLQELMREANTMASKAPVAALAQRAVAAKALIEQLKEQAQNVE